MPSWQTLKKASFLGAINALRFGNMNIRLTEKLSANNVVGHKDGRDVLLEPVSPQSGSFNIMNDTAAAEPNFISIAISMSP
jgi:hypothetical protein